MAFNSPIELSNPSLLSVKALVSGEWRSANNGNTFPVCDPSNGEIFLHCADMTRADFIEAIQVANEGYQKFHTSTTAKQRGSLLRKWHDLVVANKNDCN
jgi:succinate-semialdehyde dehydrogenase/glutarate-semialdehyde dehydrogenase